MAASLDTRTKSALLWGAVGVMAFLALVQGYALYDGPLLSLPRAAALALVVGLTTATVAYALEHRVAERAAARRLEESEPE